MRLYPYQRDGASFLAGRSRAYLGDGMGLGKTVQTAVAARALRVKRALVIAPAATLPNWRGEWKKWGSGELDAVSYADRRVSNAELDGGDYDVVVMDEAHYASNHKAIRTLGSLQAARGCARAWLLSGSPMPAHPGHLWAPIRALWPEIPEQLGLHSYDEWFDHFVRWRHTKYGRQALGVKNGGQLGPYLKKILLRRTLEEVGLELPPLRVEVSLIHHNSDVAEALREYGTDPELALARIAQESGPDASSSRLRRLLGEWKAPYIAKQIREELEMGLYGKIVILPYHTASIEAFCQILAPHGVVKLDGRTPARWRENAIEMFNRDPELKVFVGQITAAGTGLNLQVASEVVLPEPDWNPEPNRQAIKRIHRIGSTRPCRARIFAMENSLDDGIMNVIARKCQMQDAVL